MLTFSALHAQNQVLFQYLKKLKPLYVKLLRFNQQLLIISDQHQSDRHLTST
ncbi:hypothetical protein [Dapis sp. BLCC M172]|uniref:hypothetical protein n=1 Tax=Dapis sp. BLCC M172 TaxID=2975281 RepID=UPI003CEFA221